MSSISIQSEGRRHYLIGNTYPIKDKLRSAGAKWDADRKAWWTGKKELAEQLAGSAAATTAAAVSGDRPASEAPGEDATVAGRAEYKGKTYYIAGRVDRGRTHWDDRVAAVESRDGSRVLLYFRDGSRSFWAAASELRVLKSYSKPTTIAGLREYAEQAKTHGTDECRCSCHRERNAGAPGSTLYDGCDRCGCEAC